MGKNLQSSDDDRRGRRSPGSPQRDSGIESAELPDRSREEEKSGVSRRLVTVNRVLATRLHGAYSFLACAVSPQGHELSKAIAEPGRYEAFAH